MKASLTLLGLLAAGLACAQNGDRPYDSKPRGDRDLRDGVYRRAPLEGRYDAYQYGRAIHRTLRLDRDGAAELVTEVRSDRGRDDRNLGRGEIGRFGRAAVQAAGGAPVRQTGRWYRRDGTITLRLDRGELRDDRRRYDAPNGRAFRTMELTLVRQGDGLLLSPAAASYNREGTFLRPDLGRDALLFRPDEGREGGRRRDGYAGGLRIDRDPVFDVEAYEYAEERGEGRLIVRSGARTYTLRGEPRRRGDEVTLRLRSSERGERASGEVVVTLRDGRVVNVRGAGERDGHRYEFLGGRG